AGWTEIDSSRIDWPGNIDKLPNPYEYQHDPKSVVDAAQADPNNSQIGLRQLNPEQVAAQIAALASENGGELATVGCPAQGDVSAQVFVPDAPQRRLEEHTCALQSSDNFVC